VLYAASGTYVTAPVYAASMALLLSTVVLLTETIVGSNTNSLHCTVHKTPLLCALNSCLLLPAQTGSKLYTNCLADKGYVNSERWFTRSLFGITYMQLCPNHGIVKCCLQLYGAYLNTIKSPILFLQNRLQGMQFVHTLEFLGHRNAIKSLVANGINFYCTRYSSIL
jgi:hypothetical protein